MGPRGTANLEDIADYVSQAFNLADPETAGEGGSLQSRRMSKHPGRLALYRPGQGAPELLPATPGALPRDWSNDGRQLLFTQLAGRFRQLFIYDLEQETVHPVTHGPLVHVDGCFGPEGRLLYVASGVDEQGMPFSRLDVTEPGGINPRRFTDGPQDFEVACAPDGSAVAWARVDRRGREQLMTRTPALDGEIRVLGYGRFPTFSPDSEWIVYSRPDRDGRWSLQRIRLLCAMKAYITSAPMAAGAARSESGRVTRSCRRSRPMGDSSSTCPTTATNNASMSAASTDRAIGS